MKQHGKIVVWPANLDSTKSRKQGRKLTKGHGVQTPRLDELSEASKRLALEVEPTPGKSRPSSWWEKGGYLTVVKKGRRTQILRSLADGVRQIRNAKKLVEKEKR
jgi:signal recognition particle subunit SRP19